MIYYFWDCLEKKMLILQLHTTDHVKNGVFFYLKHIHVGKEIQFGNVLMHSF